MSDEPDDAQVSKDTAKEMISAGSQLVSSRGCTDIICIPIFLAHLVFFCIVTFMGMQDGNYRKLWANRDYQGQYCGIADQGDFAHGNGGTPISLENQGYQTQMMNVTEVINPIATQLVCSSAVESVVGDIHGSNSPEFDAYMTACCKNPSGECSGSIEMQDLASSSDIQSIMSAKLQEFTSPTESGLFSPSGANSDFFVGVWEEVNRYFVKVCTTDCSNDHTAATPRAYTYDPAPDSPLYPTWRLLRTHASVPTEITETIENEFTFPALSNEMCPYATRYCVPFPGIKFTASLGDVCVFGMATEVINAVGEAAGQTFTQLADAEQAEETIGSWWGDFINTLDAFAITAVCSFIVGIVFLVLLRFTVGLCVWLSIFVVFIVFIIGGACCWVRSGQCANDLYLDSAMSSATATLTLVQTSANNAFTGETTNEAMTDEGEDYNGVQYRTVTGRSCQEWSSQTPHEQSYPQDFEDQNVSFISNYCRNPGGDAVTIWCFTTDSEKRWETCAPIGVLQRTCSEGYKVTDPTMRKVLEYCAYIIWVLALLYVIGVCCLGNRIKLAISVNQVAAMFVANTPSILIVPMVQTVLAIVYCLAWAFSAAFLISQVPSDYLPMEPFANYSSAYGTETTAGACNDKWPQGFVWKDMGNLESSNDTCSGDMGVLAEGQVPSCWRCAPPRYVLDYRFAFSFFSFLWNNMLNVALGQFIIAAAVGMWFFTANDQKGKGLCGRLVRTSVWYSFRYHFGSLCFGSLLIAIVMWIRYLMMYFEQQAKAQKNVVMQYVLKCVQCCIYCFEKCLKFLTKNAYIQIALLGKNFCVSAKAAFKLIMANAIRFAVVSGLGSIIHYIGIIFIMSGTSAIGYYTLTGLHEDVSPVIPMICYIVLSYFVASIYMSVFALAVDSVLQCFIATESEGVGGDFVPEIMQKFFDSNAPKSQTATPKE